MGYNSDLAWADYTKRGWNDPHLVAYMESHDEERMAYKIKTWGAGNGNYNTKDFDTLAERIVASHAVYLSIPGPKMLWQFGELGYDYSIDFNGRVGNKPIKWDYYENVNRRNLFKTISALIESSSPELKTPP